MSLVSHVAANLINPRIRHLILHVTDKCNLRCNHCFVDHQRSNTITVQKVCEVAESIGPIFWLDIGGGEPFLLQNLSELVAPFDCEILGIPSNGYFPEKLQSSVPEILRGSRGRNTVISVSIEGFREEHERLRKDSRSFDLAFESLRVLRKIADDFPHLSVKCNTVITNQNVDRVVPFMQFMRDSGLIDFHSVIMLRGNPNEPGLFLPQFEKLIKIRPDIFRILDSYLQGSSLIKRKFLMKYYRMLWDVSLGNLMHQTQTVPCAGGQVHIVVWANGDVSSCELLPPVGNINSNSIDEIIKSDLLKDQVESVRNKMCYCTHNCVMLDSILFNPANYPRLLAS